MNKKRVILGLFLLVIAALAVGYKYDVSTFETNINSKFTHLKNKQEIKDYTIHSKQSNGLKKDYTVGVEHIDGRKGKYPREIVVSYNPFVLQSGQLDFSFEK